MSDEKQTRLDVGLLAARLAATIAHDGLEVVKAALQPGKPLTEQQEQLYTAAMAACDEANRRLLALVKACRPEDFRTQDQTPIQHPLN